MSLSPYHPGFAVVGLVLVAAAAWAAGRTVPFYRKELRVEDATRLTPLDGLRGVLCFGVMFHHAAAWHVRLRGGEWESPTTLYEMLGLVSVGLFFCVTGFLFWSRALATSGPIQAGPFLRARLLRVGPMYLISVLLIVAIIARHVHWTSARTVMELGRMLALGAASWRSLGGVEAWQVNAGVAWSLQHEWGFYFALPVLALGAHASRVWHLLLAIVATYLFIGAGPDMNFLIGIAAAYVARRADWHPRLRSRSASVVVLLLLIALAMVPLSAVSRAALPVTAVTFIVIAAGNTMFGLLTFSGLRLMGLISYSVYLLHAIAIFVMRPLLTRYLGDTPADIGRYWLAVEAGAFGILFVSMITFRWIELPFIRYEKRTRHALRTAPIVKAAVE